MKEAKDASSSPTPMMDRDNRVLALRPMQIVAHGGDRGKGISAVPSKGKSSKHAHGQKYVEGSTLMATKARSSVGTSTTGFIDGPEEVPPQTVLLLVEAGDQPRRSR
ncbi:hypothetical protein V6N13_081080 [Hibiscus sabdariffa]|uniref:Uncharacterized protein n=1 Tax=Hibiscus sabdariffa TaxID=183260 RepID=A0ABR2DBE3_9ROSI